MKRRHAQRLTTVDWAELRSRLAATNAAETPDALAARTTRILAQRAAALAAVPRPARLTSLELLAFDAGGERCAIETRFVVEVVRLPELTRLPGSAAHVLGVMNLRGEILPVFDLRPLRAASTPDATLNTRLLVLGHASAELAVLADAVQSIVAIDPNDLVATAADGASWGAFSRGLTRDALVVLDAAALLDERSLRVNDAEARNSYEGQA